MRGGRGGHEAGEEERNSVRVRDGPRSVVVLVCYSTSSGGPSSSSTYRMSSTLEVSKLNAWLKLVQ